MTRSQHSEDMFDFFFNSAPFVAMRDYDLGFKGSLSAIAWQACANGSLVEIAALTDCVSGMLEMYGCLDSGLL